MESAAAAAAPDPRPRPIATSERLHALDAMRGLAILGVLVAYTVWSLGSPPREAWSSTDNAVARIVDLLVDNKFLTMFACLFGVGVAQQWRRWEAAGYNVVPLHLRRMGFLLGVGLLHAVFLRNGDILAPYALIGLLLLAFRCVSSKALVIAAVPLTLVPYAVEVIRQALGLSWPERPAGRFDSYLAENLAWLRLWYVINPFQSWPVILALMFAGIAVGRTRLIERLAVSRSGAGRVFMFCLGLALLTRSGFEALAALWENQEPSVAHPITLNYLYQLNAWSLAATYSALLLLLMQWPAGVARSWPLRAVGRMAFTNYLLQGLVIVPVCLAFGLFDTVTPARGLWIGLSNAFVQVLFSVWWLSRHPMGPLERVWRSVTYKNLALTRVDHGRQR